MSNSCDEDDDDDMLAAEDDYFDEEDDENDDDEFVNNEPDGERLSDRFRLDEVDALRFFAVNFGIRYANGHDTERPDFVLTKLSDIIQTYLDVEPSLHKPLLFYLHHDGHDNVNKNLVANSLCDNKTRIYLNKNFVVYPWDMTSDMIRDKFLGTLRSCQCDSVSGENLASDICKLLQSPNENFPLMVVVQNFNSYHILKAASIINENSMLEQLTERLDIIKTRRDDAETKHKAYEGYQAALRDDIERDKALEKEKQEETRKKENEIRQRKLREQQQHEALARLPKEPPSDYNQQVITIKFVLPHGERLCRRFHVSDKSLAALDFIRQKGFPADMYRLVQRYPHRDFSSPLVQERTFAELKMYPNETLNVDEAMDSVDLPS